MLPPIPGSASDAEAAARAASRLPRKVAPDQALEADTRLDLRTVTKEVWQKLQAGIAFVSFGSLDDAVSPLVGDLGEFRDKLDMQQLYKELSPPGMPEPPEFAEYRPNTKT